MATLSLTNFTTGTPISSSTMNANNDAIEAIVNTSLEAGSYPWGMAIVRGPYSFANTTASINSGVTVYTPTANDILLDAWFEITTAFNGTTPKADIGSFSGTTSGLFDAAGTAVTLATADTTATGGAGISINQTALTFSLLAQDGTSTKRSARSRFTAATPIKLVVSQSGLAGGTAIGGSTGAGKLYIVTATPRAFA